MPPKSAQATQTSKAKTKANGKTAAGKAARPKSGTALDAQREESLQAVILANAADNVFWPLTVDRPQCLLPLANTPLIEYTLEWLAWNGLEEVIIYASSHADQLEKYIESSRWKASTSPFSSIVVLRCPSTSPGDALRDLDKRSLIRNDFVLVHGNLVSNVRLEPVLAQHVACREKDRSAIMTMVLRSDRQASRGRSGRAHRPVFIVNPHGRCLHYEEMTSQDRMLDLDVELFTEHPTFDVRSDLADPGIDICSPDVLGLWTDNFDYQSLRRSFLHGVLKDWELNGKTIFAHVLSAADEHYASCVQDLHSFQKIAQDLVQRKAFPFVVEANLLPGTAYSRLPQNIYIDHGVSVHSIESIESNSIIGAGSLIKVSTKLNRCTIGSECVVSAHSIISDSEIEDKCRIQPHNRLDHCILGSNIELQPQGTFKSSVIGPGMNMEQGKALDERLIGHKDTVQDDRPNNAFSRPRSDSSASLSSTSSLGSMQSSSPVHSRSSSIASQQSPSARTSVPINQFSIAAAARATSAAPSYFGSYEANATASPSTIPPANAETAATRSLAEEAAASVADGTARGQAADTVRLELLGQRLSSNAEDTLVRDALARGLVRAVWLLVVPPPSSELSSNKTSASAGIASGVADEDDAADADEVAFSRRAALPAKDAVSRIFGTYGHLLAQMGGLTKPGAAGQREQIAALKALEKECQAGPPGAAVQNQGSVKTSSSSVLHADAPRILVFALQRLYEDEIVSEEAVLGWYDDVDAAAAAAAAAAQGLALDSATNKAANASSESAEVQVRKLARTFVEWLREAESESESGASESD